jgi:hypothetical protein
VDDRSPEKPPFGSALRKPEGRGAEEPWSGSPLAAKVVGAGAATLSASPRSMASLGTHCEGSVTTCVTNATEVIVSASHQCTRPFTKVALFSSGQSTAIRVHRSEVDCCRGGGSVTVAIRTRCRSIHPSALIMILGVLNTAHLQHESQSTAIIPKDSRKTARTCRN